MTTRPRTTADERQRVLRQQALRRARNCASIAIEEGECSHCGVEPQRALIILRRARERVDESRARMKLAPMAPEPLLHGDEIGRTAK